MLPIVVPERAVRRFYFYRNEQLSEGISYQNELYGLVQKYTLQDRLKAYVMGYRLLREGESVILTTSEYRYQVWKVLQAKKLQTPAEIHTSTEAETVQS